MKVLVEMRPALDGHAGIPQETRLLFRGLALLDGVQVEGLIQSSNRLLSRGLPAARRRPLSIDRRIDRLSRVVVSLQADGGQRAIERWSHRLRLGLTPPALIAARLLGRRESLSVFDPASFRDFVWRRLFSKTLQLDDFERVTQAGFRVLRAPYAAMHLAGLATRRFGRAVYPEIDTRGFDVMIAETPYPATVAAPTRMVVRYHDAIPLLMPHTIIDRRFHQASHYQALRRNVESGAWFACVSESTRRDLLSVFPQAEARAVTIHNMVSHHYRPDDAPPLRLPEIVRTRRNPEVPHGQPGKPDALPQIDDYLLMVSTIEPRKNHLTLISAWEQLRSERFPGLKLVLVGTLGWDQAAILKTLKPWLERSEAFLLSDVPAAELRLLYRHARATVCPSYGEGFDFSGIEAMRCGGAVAASDIPVHREIFDDAADYFSPYSAEQLARSVLRVIDAPNDAYRAGLVEAGSAVSARYVPERVLPQWQAFLERLRLNPARR